MSKIEVVWFKDLDLWSVALQNQSQIKSNFPLCYLSEVLEDLTESRKITINDSLYYKEPTISSKNNTISVRKKGYGKEFKVKRRVKILPGDLVIAKMHTQNGLYAISQDEFASTSTFIPFRILDNINKDYLFAILKKTLSRLVKFDSVNRETYTTSEILKLKIPLPPLEIQREIVEKIKNIQDKIKALQDEEKKLKEEIEAYLYITLGLERKQEKKKQKVFVMEFKNLDRWDVVYNQNYNDCSLTNNKYQLSKIDDICFINPNVDFKALIQNDAKVSFLPMEDVSSNGINYFSKERNAIESKGFVKFQNGDLLWAKITPCMQNKKSVVVDNLLNGNGFGSTEFFVLRAKNKNEVDIKFVLHFLRLNSVIEEAKLNFKGSAGQQRVPKSFLENLSIPLPPLKIQKQIVEHIESKQKIIEDNKYKIENLQSDINKELQELILA